MAKKIQVVNTLTGEVLDWKYNNPIQLKAIYLEAQALEKTVKRAREKIAIAMEKMLGDEEYLDTGDGYKFMWIRGATKKYRREVVAEYLDEDQMALVTQIDGKKLKELLANLVKEGAAPSGAWKAIEESADTKPKKAYVKLEKA